MCKETMLPFLFSVPHPSLKFLQGCCFVHLSWADGLCQSKKGKLLKVLGAA